jgi:hypothetical protein
VRVAILAMTQFGVLETPLRNIRFAVDGTALVARLIPERVTLETPKPGDFPEALHKYFENARLVVEGPEMLVLTFEHVVAVAVDTDVDVDLFGGLHAGWKEAPKLPDSKSYYPLLEIADSHWKSQLPDFRGRDEPWLHHFRAISAECSLDILGTFPTGAWEVNPAAQ